MVQCAMYNVQYQSDIIVTCDIHTKKQKKVTLYSVTLTRDNFGTL